ncbi:MAG: N-acetylmuramic acid 6-phosphate etherase [Pseudomonadota bacterium]
MRVTDLHQIPTEQRNPRTGDIDLLSPGQIVRRISEEDKLVADAVERELPAIARVVDRIVAAFRRGGRLIYIGAGTSGRLGVLDAAECPPTFSVPPDMVVGIIAGGDRALRRSIEGAEDDAKAGAADLADVNLTARDVVVGIAASGRTPYVLGAFEFARTLGAGTVALTTAPNSPISRAADISIAPAVGPEALTGSTRMKAGTAQKMVLNMLSTGAMIRIGKTYGNLMVDVAVSNDKLRARALSILCEVTGVDGAVAETLLETAGGDVKCAILMALSGVDRETADQRLCASGGVLRRAMEAIEKHSA